MSPAKRTVRRKPLADEPVRPHRVAATHTISRAYGRAVAGFTLVAILLAGVILMVSGSSAKVVVTPKVSFVDVPFTIAVVAGDASSSANSIAGRVLELATSTSETIDVPASSSQTPDQTAKVRGTVTLRNTSASSQTLVATTRLQTPSALIFRLIEPVTVPAHGTATAEVVADVFGPAYEITPTTFTIPGLNPSRQQEVTASSDVAFKLPLPPAGLTEEKIAYAREQALANIGNRLASSMQPMLFPTEKLGSVQGGTVTTTALDFGTTAKPGDQATKVTFSGTVRVSMTLFNQQTLQAMANAVARAEHPEAKDEDGSVTFTVRRASSGSSLGTIEGHTTIRTSHLSLEAKDLTGRTKQDAAVYVQLLDGVDHVSIKVRPAWFKRLPQDPSRISIVVEDPR